MPSLTDVIARIPGLAGYEAAGQLNRERELQGLNQAATLIGLQQKMQAIAREQQFREAISQAKTPEEQAAIAAKFGGPEGVLKHADRQTQIAATKEATLARLQQTAQQFELTHQARLRNLTRQEDRDAEIARHNGIIEQMQNYAQRVTGEKLFYETGTRLAPPSGAATTSAAPVAASADSAAFGGITPDQERAAAELIRSQGGGTVNFGPGGQIIPQPKAAAAPQPAPVEAAPAPLVQPAPNNLDARDLGAGSRGPVMGTTPVAPAAAPQPLQPKPLTISDAPAGLTPRGKQQWLLQQTKPSIAGNSPITPETATRIAQQALEGDTNALSGLARNQAAMAQVNNEITRLGSESGITGGDIAARRGMNAANRVALTAVTKDLAAITPFKEMLDQNAKVAMDLGRKIADDKTNAAFINRPLLWVKNNLSDRPDIAEYLAQMHFVEVEAARVLTQPRLVGQLTDQAISDMKSVVSGNMTIASTEAVLNRIMADGNNRINAMRTQQGRILSDIRGTAPRTRDSDKPKAENFFR